MNMIMIAKNTGRNLRAIRIHQKLAEGAWRDVVVVRSEDKEMVFDIQDWEDLVEAVRDLVPPPDHIELMTLDF